jgi:large subunit ribosomal protein L9
MRVILTADVYKQGVAGEVVNVADGYARNYLIPQGLAVKATSGTLKQADKLRREAAARRARVYQEMQGVAEQVDGLELTFAVKAGSSGKLYGSITMSDVADALQEKMGLEIDRRRVGDTNSLRELGEHMVPVRLTSDLVPKVRVIIHREGESPEETMAEVEEREEAEAEAETLAEAAMDAAEADEATAEADDGTDDAETAGSAEA